MTRPRTSTLMLAALIAVALLLVAGVWVLDRTTEAGGKTLVTVRLWDQQVAAAYRDSFAEFTRAHPDIEVRVDVVTYASYFDTLRTDVAGGVGAVIEAPLGESSVGNGRGVRASSPGRRKVSH